MNTTKTCQDGELIMIYLSLEQVEMMHVDSNTVFQNKYGKFYGADIVGKPLGGKWYARNTDKKGRRGYVYPLWPSPELWTKAVTQRTQIVYTSDISLVIQRMEVASGSIVLETGTGSGSMTFALANTVYPEGHVYSFDCNEDRIDSLQRSLKNHALASVVTLECRDIIQNGFGIHWLIDAIFLDIPEPWKVLDMVAQVLRSDGTLVVYSPCIEQVQKTCEKLSQQEVFGMLQTFTTTSKRYETHSREVCKNACEKAMKDKLSFISTEKEDVGTSNYGEEKEETMVFSYPCYRYYRSHTAYLTFARKLQVTET
eukprot:jgi/Galph1/1938/GphlegSOOS_G601.1